MGAKTAQRCAAVANGPTGAGSPKRGSEAPAHPAVAAVASTPAFLDLAAALPAGGESRTAGGMVGSLPWVVAAALARREPNRLWVVAASSPNQAADAFQDLEALAPGLAVHYPQRELVGGFGEDPSPVASGRRVEAVEAVLAGRARMLVATWRALQELAAIPRDLARMRFVVSKGPRPGRSAVLAALEERGFRRVPTVEEVGCYAVRGGIVDMFSLGAAGPARIEFDGDDVRSVRFFDVHDQLSTEVVDKIDILPVAFRAGEIAGGRDPGAAPAAETPPASLLDRLPDGACLVTTDDAGERKESVAATWRDAARRHREALRHDNPAVAPSRLFLAPARFEKRVAALARVRLSEIPAGDVVFDALRPPRVNGDVSVLREFLASAAQGGAATLVLCENEGQAARLEELVADRRGGLPRRCGVVAGAVGGGFRLPGATPPANILVDHELFRRRRARPSVRRFRGSASVESLAELSPGDYVVHMDHGIGRFRGLERVDVGGESLDALVIAYAHDELLRVPVHALGQVERWIGPDPEAAPPRLDKIGGRRWKNLKRKTEDEIQKTTAELLDLYAVRKSRPGHAFSPDQAWQRALETAFPYDETPDQQRAVDDVKRDMESPTIMDRLVCGDAGYGKTEVAVRAAFKAVQDGKQVAVLAPTTVLAAQHAGSFRDRLGKYPVRVASLSRFEGPAEQRGVLRGLRDGTVDVVVGTHRLLSGDVVFKDLGLLVVDEEQRMGVRQKERLKRLRATVDVLTLSATPIPRTLHLSLAGIRDMSLIRTPPRNRLPIVTRVVSWHDQVVAEACEREIDRGGQVFFLHNRVETIDTVAERVRMLVAPASVDVAHGQMRARRLHQVMSRFVEGRTDVLVCSAIIENGLDVSNANTLIVDRADRFGLSQLYQIRGRVGRSDRRAFCYLIAPEELAEDAARRLSVLEHYTELGSGYQIALRDLQARGAGNLLGVQQSGFAHAVGVEAYLRLLKTAVRRIKSRPGSSAGFSKPEVSMDQGAFLPADYVADERQKLHLYRRLAAVSTRADVAALADELADRFGPLPAEARRLLDQAAFAVAGQDAGVARVHVRGRRARLDFRPDAAPRMSALAGALDGEDVVVEAPRLSPLAVELDSGTEERLPHIVIRAMDALGETGEHARTTAAKDEDGPSRTTAAKDEDGLSRTARAAQDGTGGVPRQARASAARRVHALFAAIGVACAGLPAACGDPALAEAGGRRLGASGAAALIAEHSTLPADTAVARTVAELWVDYTLLADRLAADSTLSGLDVDPIVEPQLHERMLAGLHQDALEPDTVVGEEELAARFAADLPGARATASQILLLFPADATQMQQDSVLSAANALRRRLAAGESFADLAAAFSDDAGNASRGGRLGTFERGEMLAPVDQAVFAMRPGELSDPVRTELGYHVLKLDALEVPELSEVGETFRLRILMERIAEAEAAFLRQMDSTFALALASDAVGVARALARSRPKRLGKRAARRPLVTWQGGAYTAGEFAALARRSSNAFVRGVAEANDDDLRQALHRLGQEQLLLAEARARGLEPGPQVRDSLAGATRDAIREGARRIGLFGDPPGPDPSAVDGADPPAGTVLQIGGDPGGPLSADGAADAPADPERPSAESVAPSAESLAPTNPDRPSAESLAPSTESVAAGSQAASGEAAARVEAVLIRILSGRQEVVPLGNVTFLLRTQAPWRIHASRAGATAQRARALQSR